LLKPGDAVVDLGAAPGGWLQVASQRVGQKGIVLGIDLKSIEQLDAPNVFTIVGDIEEQGIGKRILNFLGRKADVVLSDASPNLTGIWELDQARQLSLATSSIKIASEILRDGGSMIIKAFQGSSFNDLLSSLKLTFKSVDIFRPRATRKHSSELYLVCKGFEREPL